MKTGSSPLVFVFKQALECQGDGELSWNSLVSGPLCETEETCPGEKDQNIKFSSSPNTTP